MGSLLSLPCCCFGSHLGVGGGRCSGFPAGVLQMHWVRCGLQPITQTLRPLEVKKGAYVVFSGGFFPPLVSSLGFR